MKPVETLQEQQAKAARAALEALQQAFAYYTPEAPAGAQLPSGPEELFEYYRAA